MATEVEIIGTAIVASLRDLVGAILDEREAGTTASSSGKGKDKPAAGKGKGKGKEEAIDFDSLKKKLMRVVNEKDGETAKNVLKKFKVAKLGALDESKFEKFNAALDEILEEEGGDEDIFGEDDE